MAITQRGFLKDPRDKDNVRRCLIIGGQLRSWDFPRSIRSIQALQKGFAASTYPGVYVLLDSNSKLAYVGETKDLANRMQEHNNNPVAKISNWDTAYVVNDGRDAMYSHFNDTGTRQNLELHVRKLLRANNYTVISTAQMYPSQSPVLAQLTDEVDYMLRELGLISKGIKPGQEEIPRDEWEPLLEKKNYQLADLTVKDGTINGESLFIRPGSEKPKGWQITFRDLLKDALKVGKGYLLFNRGPGYLIPLKELKNNLITDRSKFNQNTIDIFIEFGPQDVIAKYRGDATSISRFML